MNPSVLAISTPFVSVGVVMAVLVVVSVVLIRSRRGGRIRAYQVEGTVTRLDQSASEMSVEFVSPRTKKRVELTGVVPPDCSIEDTNGAVELGVIKCGDRVRVAASWDRRSKVATPLSIRIVAVADEALGNESRSAAAMAAAETMSGA